MDFNILSTVHGKLMTNTKRKMIDTVNKARNESYSLCKMIV